MTPAGSGVAQLPSCALLHEVKKFSCVTRAVCAGIEISQRFDVSALLSSLQLSSLKQFLS